MFIWYFKYLIGTWNIEMSMFSNHAHVARTTLRRLDRPRRCGLRSLGHDVLLPELLATSGDSGTNWDEFHWQLGKSLGARNMSGDIA